MSKPIVSIIVPVYNAMADLSFCIEAILNQSYTTFELLLINDGSKDDSLNICKQYSRGDTRVKIFHKSNGGVSSARNTGIENSKGEYIVFCDADDSIERTYLENLMNYCKYDIVLCSFKEEPKGIVRSFPNLESSEKFHIGKLLEKYIYTGFSMPWAKLYKKEIISQYNLTFDEKIDSGEDTLWVSQYLKYVKSMKLLSYVGYNYNRRNNSLSLKGISQQTMTETVDKISQSYSILETTYQSNLTEWKLNIGMYFFHRYIVCLSSLNIGEITAKLKENCEKKMFNPIFHDKVYVLKGFRLKFFNFLVRHRLYWILAIYVKQQKRYL